MLKLPRLALTLLALAAAFPASALGADATVTIAGKAFGPGDVTIAPGDSVTWNWNEGTHNVHVTSGPASFDSGFKGAGGTYTKQLTAAGVYAYQCDAHPSMRGQITVAGPAPAAGAAPTVSFAPPALRAVKVSKLAVVSLSTSAPGTLSVRLVRAGRVARRATLPLAAGPNRVPLSVRGLGRGRYRVHLTAITAAGQRSAPVVRSLVVTRAVLARKQSVTRPAPAPLAARAPAPVPAPPADDNGGQRPGKGSGHA